MNEEERYDQVCKPAFERIDKNFGAVDKHFALVAQRFKSVDDKLDKITEALKGNGKVGILERIRNLEKVNKAIMGAGVFILCAIVVEIISLLVKVL